MRGTIAAGGGRRHRGRRDGRGRGDRKPRSCPADDEAAADITRAYWGAVKVNAGPGCRERITLNAATNSNLGRGQRVKLTIPILSRPRSSIRPCPGSYRGELRFFQADGNKPSTGIIIGKFTFIVPPGHQTPVARSG